MPKICVILPVALPRSALDLFAAQIPAALLKSDYIVEFNATRGGASLLDSPYECTLADIYVLEAGMAAAAEGADAICSFSMSDSGVSALRSRLDVPIIGAAQASMTLAAQLGLRFSIVTMWEPWRRIALDKAKHYGFADQLASVRSIEVRPDTQELLTGKEEVVFERLEAVARAAITHDGAEVIILGSTTMYQSHAHLVVALPCPVVNPGTAAVKACENLLDLRLCHSRLTYPAPENLHGAPFNFLS